MRERPAETLSQGQTLAPVHPGEILLEEFIRPHGLSAIRLAQRLGVPRTRVERLVSGDTAVTLDTALRLERFFGASAEFWLNLQQAFDLAKARTHPDRGIDGIVPLGV